MRVVVVDRLTLDPYVDVVLRLLVSPFSYIGLGEGIEGFQVLDRGGPDGGGCQRILAGRDKAVERLCGVHIKFESRLLLLWCASTVAGGGVYGGYWVCVVVLVR